MDHPVRGLFSRRTVPYCNRNCSGYVQLTVRNCNPQWTLQLQDISHKKLYTKRCRRPVMSRRVRSLSLGREPRRWKSHSTFICAKSDIHFRTSPLNGSMINCPGTYHLHPRVSSGQTNKEVWPRSLVSTAPPNALDVSTWCVRNNHHAWTVVLCGSCERALNNAVTLRFPVETSWATMLCLPPGSAPSTASHVCEGERPGFVGKRGLLGYNGSALSRELHSSGRGANRLQPAPAPCPWHCRGASDVGHEVYQRPALHAPPSLKSGLRSYSCITSVVLLKLTSNS